MMHTSSVEAPALVALEQGLVTALVEAPRGQAIGAACAFLLHCADSTDHAKLRRALNAPVSRTGRSMRLIDCLTRLANSR